MGNTCGDRRIEEVIEPPCLVEVRRRDLPIGQLSEEEIQESIDLLTSLSHPNLIKVQKCVRNANNTLSVFEEYPSESLEHLLNSKRSFINFKEIMIGLATGLQYLHRSKRVAHECLSPANIYFNGTTPVIGGVLDCLNNLGKEALPQVAYYSAPETQAGCFGECCDVWSLGLILLEIVIEQPLKKVLMSPLQPWKIHAFPKNSHLNRIKQGRVRRTVRLMLDRSPAQRPATHQIRQYYRQQPIPTSTDTRDRLYRMYQQMLYYKISCNQYFRESWEHFFTMQLEAEKGNQKAIFFIVDFFLRTNKKEKARKWFKQLRDIQAKCMVMPRLIPHEPDLQSQRKLVQEWSTVRSKHSTLFLAQCYAYGLHGFEKDEAQALQLLNDLSKLHEGLDGVLYLRTMMQAANQGYPFGDDPKFQEEYRKAAHLGDYDAIWMLNLCLSNRRELRKALYYQLMIPHAPDTSASSSTQTSIGRRYRELGDLLSCYRWQKIAVPKKTRKQTLEAFKILGF